MKLERQEKEGGFIMAYVKISVVEEIPVGSKKKVDVNGEQVLIVNIDGRFFAMANKCPHMGGSLAEGNLEGNLIVCPRHHAKFDVTTGKATGDAKIAFLKFKVPDVKKILVKVEGNDILVDAE